jgi:hypothetical protein
MSDPVASTPGRSTLLFLDTPVYNAARQQIIIPRSGDQIGEESNWKGHESTNVAYLAERTWALKRNFQGWEEAAFSSSAFITSSDGTLVPNGAMYFGARSPSDLTGITATGYASQTVPTFTKIVAYGDSFSQELAADTTALPRATATRETIPMNRVFAGTVTYPANQGFVFLFRVTAGTVGQDWLYNFYFGGPSDATFVPGAESHTQGRFCVAFRGDGTAALFSTGHSSEFADVDTWLPRTTFRYSAATRSVEGWHWCVVLPHKNNRIIFQSLQADASPSGGAGLFDDLKLGSKRLPVNTTIYKHSIAQTGHMFTTSITGAGIVRVDARADMRWQFSIAKEGWKTSGTLYDAPFSLPRVLPTGTVITLVGDTDIPSGGAITADLYRADTGAICTTGPATGQWLSETDVRDYFIKFGFTGDGKDSPFLRSRTVQVDAQIQLFAPGQQRADLIQNLSATSGSVDPSTDSAHILLEDPAGDASRLSLRARIPCQLRTYADDGITYSVLFDGEIMRAGAGRKYAQVSAIPGVGSATDWRVYDCLLAGAWARLYDKVAVSTKNYSVDYNAAKLPNGSYPPWRVTDIIVDLFHSCGVPDEQLDIPTIELRLFPSPNGVDPIRIPPTNSRYAPFIVQLARIYLDAFIVWDPNAGPHGMWRLVQAPQSPYLGSLLWDFVFGPAGDFPGPIHHPGRYGTEQTFIYRDSFQTWVQAPECNHVVVWGMAEQKGDTAFKYSQELRNFKSYDPDPSTPTADITSVDYIGYEQTLLYPDPLLRSPEAMNFVCRRIYDIAAHGQNWCSFNAPLVLVTDPFDTHQTRPRPLRLGDVVRVDGQITMIRNCAIEIDRNRGGDKFQMGTYTGVAL